MVITTRIAAPAVSGRTSPTTVLAQLLSRFARRSEAGEPVDRDRHRRLRREAIEREQRSVRAELAMLYTGVRR
jgi:hypothetical protein